jgi:hypothetical protein
MVQMTWGQEEVAVDLLHHIVATIIGMTEWRVDHNLHIMIIANLRRICKTKDHHYPTNHHLLMINLGEEGVLIGEGDQIRMKISLEGSFLQSGLAVGMEEGHLFVVILGLFRMLIGLILLCKDLNRYRPLPGERIVITDLMDRDHLMMLRCRRMHPLLINQFPNLLKSVQRNSMIIQRKMMQ